ncbi:MAG: TIGR03435 family protein, partial [Acidobacteriota bacterium]|nr:TIGR03435 family protein [Acidobacteriota bacterium]
SGTDIDQNDTVFTASNLPLKMLLDLAYNIRPDLIFGVPAPLASMRFDIQAKILDADPQALKKLTEAQRRAMFLPILRDRFHVQAHTEEKTLPLYELVVLPGGPRFKPSAVQDLDSANTTVHNTALTATHIPMKDLAHTLSNQMHRTVIDKTGLTGVYDVELKWSRDDAPPADDAPPTLVTALQEQLGLKLQPAKGPVLTLVVDHAEPPTEN